MFVRRLQCNSNVTEELLSVESLQDPTKVSDLFESVSSGVKRNGLNLNTLITITTDGAPSLAVKCLV